MDQNLYSLREVFSLQGSTYQRITESIEFNDDVLF
jgi:hypothetical protein